MNCFNYCCLYMFFDICNTSKKRKKEDLAVFNYTPTQQQNYITPIDKSLRLLQQSGYKFNYS